jgi:hypothetical protein
MSGTNKIIDKKLKFRLRLNINTIASWILFIQFDFQALKHIKARKQAIQTFSFDEGSPPLLLIVMMIASTMKK